MQISLLSEFHKTFYYTGIFNLFVELVLGLILLDVILVALFEIFGQDDVAVFANGLHAGFLANGVDVCATDAIRSSYVVLKAIGELCI